MKTELTTPESASSQNGSPAATSQRRRSATQRISSPGQEAIDAILWRLEARGGDEKSLVVGITGCTASAGATTVAANLARSAGAQGCRVLLVSCAPLSRNRRGKAETGLWDILSGDVSPRECEPTPIDDNVFSLGSGTLAGGTARVNPQLVAEMLEEFRSQYDAVIVDLPAAEDLGSALPLARHLPGVVLVVRSEKTTEGEAQRALDRLAEDGVPVYGAILNEHQNQVPRWLRRWF